MKTTSKAETDDIFEAQTIEQELPLQVRLAKSTQNQFENQFIYDTNRCNSKRVSMNSA